MRILHLEDEPLDSELARALLHQEGLNPEIDRVDTLPEFQAALERGGFDIILSDYSMPGVDTKETMRLARQVCPDVPFIILSGKMGEDAAIESLKAGASDYVLKNRIKRLVPAVNRALQEAAEQARRRQTEEALRETEARERQRAAELAKAREELRQYADNLEKLVQERTLKLEEAVHELEHFSYTITHDMRAPLRALQGFSQLLLLQGGEHSANTSAKEFLKRIMNSAERMDALITDALQYSRAIRSELKLQPVTTGKLLREIIESYPNLQAPNAEVCLQGQFPVVLANEAALTQCFSNLLGNAVKFVAPGVLPKVRVWAQEVVQPTTDSQLSAKNFQLIRIWVEDNGIGIPKEHHERIFGMFQQLNRTYEGTGIGLALVRKNAERMGGRVGLESEPGQGSRFWLELRRVA